MEEAITLKDKLIKTTISEKESSLSLAIGVLEKEGKFFQVASGEKEEVEARRVHYSHLADLYNYHVVEVATQELLVELLSKPCALATYTQSQHNSI